MIIFTYAVEGDYNPEILDPVWQEWRNALNRDDAEAMAAQKLIRERGGLGESPELLVTVYSYTEKTVCHDTGRPMQVHRVLFRAAREEAFAS